MPEEYRVTSSTIVGTGDHQSSVRPAIQVQGLNHYYGEGELRKQVLFENELTIAEGELVIMTGPSGSGKTTLLTLIGTLRRCQEGSLKVLGREFLGASKEELVKARRDIGFIFQAHNLFASLTAFQNVRMGMELFGISDEEMTQRAEYLLTRLGLGDRIHYKPRSLSGGQKQRVAVARGLAHRPRLILADEPTAALDKQSGREVVSLFQELTREEKCTIIMVTHDNRILDVADRIVNMVDGRIASNVLVEESSVICNFLAKCPIFEGLTPGTLSHIADKMRAEKFSPEETIIQQGDVGDKFYLIRQGSVDVVRQTDGKRKHVVTLGDGDYFGEMALLSNEPRNASVIAKQDAMIYSLGAEHFQAVVKGIASFENELRRALFDRQ